MFITLAIVFNRFRSRAGKPNTFFFSFLAFKDVFDERPNGLRLFQPYEVYGKLGGSRMAFAKFARMRSLCKRTKNI